MPHIAPINRSHLAAAKRVIATVVVEHYFDGHLTSDELLGHYEKSGYLNDLDRLEAEYDGRRGSLLGVFAGEILVGTGGVREMDSETGELVRLWLLRDFRGLGLGRDLTNQLLQFARDAGWRRLRLDTSQRCASAVALFKKLGFLEIPPYKESIGDCFMQLDLSPGSSPGWAFAKSRAD